MINLKNTCWIVLEGVIIEAAVLAKAGLMAVFLDFHLNFNIQDGFSVTKI